MNKLTNYLLIVSFSLYSTFAFGIEGNNWEIYYEDAKIKISFQKQECDFNNQFNQEFIIFKIENLSYNTISIKWDSKIWHDESCINCEQDDPEFRKEIKLESKKIMEGNCAEHNALRIFSRFTDDLEDMPGIDKIITLTNFELKNLNITDE